MDTTATPTRTRPASPPLPPLAAQTPAVVGSPILEPAALRENGLLLHRSSWVGAGVAKLDRSVLVAAGAVFSYERFERAADCVAAAESIRPARLSRITVAGREVVLASDTHHNDVKAFKARGAFVAVSAAYDRGARHCVGASTGNHAQGVAAACRHFGIAATIFVPSGTPVFKLERIRALGVELRVSDAADYDTVAREARAYSEAHGHAFVHPFDDPDVILGQGTLLCSIVDALGESPGTLIVPVGGGGLAAGLLLAATYRCSVLPDVIGVEPARRASMLQALLEGGCPFVPPATSLAQGANVGAIGSLTAPVLRDGLVAAAAVTERAIAGAMISLAEAGVEAEGAGALSLAALHSVLADFPFRQGPIVLVVSGASIDASEQANPRIA